MWQRIRNHFPDQLFPILLLVVCLLCFGILAPKLGFYWDDWSKTLVNILYGMQGYKAYYAGDRPYSGWTHILFVSLFGNGRVIWQYINLGLRWAGATAMWWSLTRLWPRARIEISLAAVLFAVYPVFTQQAAAVTFHQQLLQYAVYFVSIGLMIIAVRDPGRYWILTIISFIAQGIQLTVTEYFVGVEMLRPFLIWIVISESEPKFIPQIKKAFKFYIPYFIFTAAYIYWRLVLLKLPNADPYETTTVTSLINNPVATLIQWVQTAWVDFLHVIMGSWGKAFDLGISANITPSGWFSWAIGIILIGILLVFYQITKKEPLNNNEQVRWVQQALVVGILAVLLGCLPAWAIGRSVLDDFHANRYALPGMFGAALIIVAISIWLTRTNWHAVLIVTILAAMAGGYQVRVLNDYRWVWSAQQDFYWQLYWRAPHLEPGTALFLQREPFQNQGLFSTSAAVNLLYPQPEGWEKLGYWVYTLEPRYKDVLPEEASPNLGSTFRSLSFRGNINQSIMLHFDSNYSNCWWVLDSRDILHPYLPDILKDYLVIADLNNIHNLIGDDRLPPAELFGKEPEHGWCYYFEKAELAYQLQDWVGTAALGREAMDAGYFPNQTASNVPREWLSYIEAFAKTGEIETAMAISVASYRQDPQYQTMLCDIWNNLDQEQVVNLSNIPSWSGLGCSELANK